jgi:SAM-dependent methyltransferase
VTRDHVSHNRAFWDADAESYQAAHGDELTRTPLAWGAYRVPEAELHVLGDVGGAAVLELGCGGAQWSIALAELGASVVGIDLSQTQLSYARGSAPTLPLVLANGEQLPFVAARFDIVFCDHGALSFCTPDVIVPECARVLRPGGILAFSGTHPLLYLTWSEKEQRQTRRLQMPYDELGRMESTEGTIDWALPPGAWIDLLRGNGFEIEALLEICAPDGVTTTYESYAPPKWARKWPAEWIWKARRR